MSTRGFYRSGLTSSDKMRTAAARRRYHQKDDGQVVVVLPHTDGKGKTIVTGTAEVVRDQEDEN